MLGVIILFVGGGLVVAGLILAMVRTSIVARAEPVQLAVVDIDAQWVGEGERAKVLMYEILDGEHKGLRSMSLVKGRVAQPKIGDQVSGMIDPKTQAVLSDTDASYRFWQAVWIACVGAMIVCAALVWPRS